MSHSTEDIPIRQSESSMGWWATRSQTQLLLLSLLIHTQLAFVGTCLVLSGLAPFPVVVCCPYLGFLIAVLQTATRWPRSNPLALWKKGIVYFVSAYCSGLLARVAVYFLSVLIVGLSIPIQD